jgi:hypothetical protein
MPLWSFDGAAPEKVETIPHEKDFQLWRRRLTPEEYQAIIDEMNRVLDSGEIHTAGWIPGSDWTGTVYEPIFTKACRGNEELSGKCYGLFLWVTVMDRAENWGFGNYEKDGKTIGSKTYFLLTTKKLV